MRMTLEPEVAIFYLVAGGLWLDTNHSAQQSRRFAGLQGARAFSPGILDRTGKEASRTRRRIRRASPRARRIRHAE